MLFTLKTSKGLKLCRSSTRHTASLATSSSVASRNNHAAVTGNENQQWHSPVSLFHKSYLSALRTAVLNSSSVDSAGRSRYLPAPRQTPRCSDHKRDRAFHLRFGASSALNLPSSSLVARTRIFDGGFEAAPYHLVDPTCRS